MVEVVEKEFELVIKNVRTEAMVIKLASKMVAKLEFAVVTMSKLAEVVELFVK